VWKTTRSIPRHDSSVYYTLNFKQKPCGGADPNKLQTITDIEHEKDYLVYGKKIALLSLKAQNLE
jgi:hypothetical protein